MDFKDTYPHDLAWMELEDIIKCISNTFTSKVIEKDDKWTIIEADWQILVKDNKYNIYKFPNDLINKVHKIYFHIFTDTFLILRGHDAASIKAVVDMSMIKNDKIVDTKTDYANGNSFATILKGRNFYGILFATDIVPKGKEFVRKDDKYHSLSTLCGCDPDVKNDAEEEDCNIAYFSDLLIGARVRLFSNGL